MRTIIKRFCLSIWQIRRCSSGPIYALLYFFLILLPHGQLRQQQRASSFACVNWGESKEINFVCESVFRIALNISWKSIFFLFCRAVCPISQTHSLLLFSGLTGKLTCSIINFNLTDFTCFFGWGRGKGKNSTRMVIDSSSSNILQRLHRKWIQFVVPQLIP